MQNPLRIVDPVLRELNYLETEGLYYSDVQNTEFNLPSTSDLQPGVYEGGLKLWECSVDLLRYLKTIPIPPRVLELGCGQGLPGIYCLTQGSSTVFQDFNDYVLQYITSSNTQKNLNSLSHSKFLAGPWCDYSFLGHFDLILASETIYNPLDYTSLLTAISSTLTGICLVSCKGFYFGVGGNKVSFSRTAESRGFCVETLQEIRENSLYPRYILKLTL